MEMKQLASINLNSSQLKASKSAPLAETSDSKQQSPFEARLDKQIKQLRESGRDEDKITQPKDDKNQRDSVSDLDGNMREKSISRAREEREADKKELESAPEIALDKSAGTQKADPVDEQQEAGESPKVAGEVDPRLPLAGMLLPLSEKNLQGLNGASDIELSEGVEEKLIAIELPAQIKLAAERINGLNQGRAQVAIPASISGSASDSGATPVQTLIQPPRTGAATDSARLAEQAVIQVPAQTALNQTDKVSKQFDQSAAAPKTLNEMSAIDIIAQATRLLQVPAATTLSKSMVENAGAENSLQQAVFQAPATGALSGGATSVNNPLLNNSNSVIGAPLSGPDWSNQMTQKVSMMLQGGIQTAEIKLNPAHLGPMEIKLSMSDDRASISFVAQHAPVRDAIEQAMPKLREMLEEQGLNLADVDVSTQSERHSEQRSDQQNSGAGGKQQTVDSVQSADNLQGDHSLGSTEIIIDRTVSIYA